MKPVVKALLIVALAVAPAADGFELVRQSRWPFGGADAIAVRGGMAFVGCGSAYGVESGLAVYDVSDPTNPVAVAAVNLPGYPRDVVLAGDFAYVAADDAGLRIVNVRDPLNPVEVGGFPTPDDALGVAVDGQVAYVAADEAGLRIIGVANPATPFQIAFVDVAGNRAQDVAVHDGLAYVADRNLGLRVVDVSPPWSPATVGQLPNGPGYATAVAVDWPHVHVGLGEVISGGGLRVVDVGVPSAPVEVAYLENRADSLDVAVVGSTVYLAAELDGLSIIDVSAPGDPVLRSKLPAVRSDRNITVIGGYVYAASAEGLRVVDVSDPDDPIQVSWFPSLAAGKSAVVFGDRALVPHSLPSSPAPAGAFVFDLSHDDRVLPTAYVPLAYSASSPQAAAGGDSYGYVSGGDLSEGHGFRVVDMGHPDEPTVLGHYQTEKNVRAIAADQPIVYVDDYDYVAQQYLLRSIDVSDPLNPVQIGMMHLNQNTNQIVVRDGLAYLASGGQLEGLTIVDVADPAAMAVEGELSVGSGGPPLNVTVGSGYAFLTIYDRIYMVDVSDPANPALATSDPVPVPIWARAMAIRWPRVYVISAFGDDPGIITAVDYSDLHSPVIVDSVEVSPSQFVASVGDRLLVPSVDGFEVIAIHDSVFDDGFESGNLSAWSDTIQ